MIAPGPVKLGIIAGAGVLPGLLVAACRAQHRPYYLLGLTGFADPAALGQDPDAWIRLGEAGQGFDRLRAANVSQVVMAGAVKRPSFGDLRPDMKTVAFFARIAGQSFLGDDGLLRAVIAEIEREGFPVVGPDEILPSLLAPLGVLGAYSPDAEAYIDIERGIAAALSLGRKDRGQAVVVRADKVVDREDDAGTAALLARCATHPGYGGVLVKMKKPRQDRRVDLPAIGPDTVTQAKSAKLTGIAVEAGASLILDRDAVRAAADAAGLFLVGVNP